MSNSRKVLDENLMGCVLQGGTAVCVWYAKNYQDIVFQPDPGGGEPDGWGDKKKVVDYDM